MNKVHTLWKHKYSPEKVEDYVGSDVIIHQVNKYIKTNNPPNLCFYGETGTGKTCLAKLLVANLQCEHLYLNASDDNGIDTVRTNITDFAAHSTFAPLKVVILDDSFNLTPDAQNALLNVIEMYAKTTRFIITTNHKHKIIPALLGRLVAYHIEPPSKKDVKKKVATILKKEKVQYDPKDVSTIVERYFPSIRMCIDYAQNMVEEGQLVLDFSKVPSEVYSQILEHIKSGEWEEVRQLVIDAGIKDHTDLYSFLYKSAVSLSPEKYPDIIFALSEANKWYNLVPDREILLASTILTIINIIK